METFKPVRVSEYFLKQIAKGLKAELYATLFKPIFEVLDDNNINVFNAKNALFEAINAGRVYYQDGAFRTEKRFSNEVAKELEKLGATFRNGAYYVAKSALPIEIESVLASVAAREAVRMATLNALLLRLASEVGTDTAVRYFIEKSVERLYKKLQMDLAKSTKERKIPTIDISVDVPDIKLPKGQFDNIDKYWKNAEKKLSDKRKKINGLEKELERAKEQPKQDALKSDLEKEKDELRQLNDEVQALAPKLTLDDVEIDGTAKKIAEDYTHNMDFWVKKWKAKEITTMRQDVLKMVQKGQRRDAIKKYFMDRWGIAERKAEFLARNESNLASSVLKATHYQNEGCAHFKWLRSTSIEKRELHLEYAKEEGNQYGIGGTNIFAFNNPPIIEQIKTKNGSFVPKPNGKRGLPGQTYNCECNLVGIKDPQFYIQREKIENAKRNLFEKIKYSIQNGKQCNNYPWRYRRFGEGAKV